MSPTEPNPAMSPAGLDTSDREISVSRTIHVPRRFVFEAWTQERHISRWLGPDGFTITSHRFEFRPEGVWEFTMHGPDGTDYPNRIEWREIQPPSRVTWLHGEREDDPRAFESEVTLVEDGDRTHVTLRSVLPTKAQRDEVVEKYGAIEGGRQTLEHLDTYAAKLAEGAGDA
jgi:uncharacterized protein YndB with AHSA1/START domain